MPDIAPPSNIDASNDAVHFQFATAGQIRFGWGRLQEVEEIAPTLGSHALVVTGRSRERAGPLLDLLARQGIQVTRFSVTDEPTVHVARQGTRQARSAGCDFVIGFGGGSALDTAKAIAALLTNPGDPLDYLEVIGRGRPLQNPAAPILAIPTTAGTGSEVTRNAVLASPGHRVKVSLRSPLMLPRVALVDPALTLSVPPHITAFTGMDALTQVLEPLVSRRANPLTDGFCREGLPRAARSLRRAVEEGQDRRAREEMALVSLLGGLALANAGLGAVHGFAGPFGGMFHAPHGAVCAALLPHVMAVNVAALRARQPQSPALDRYGEIARLLTGQAEASPEAGIEWVLALQQALTIPPLSAYGLTPDHFPALMEKARRSSSMKGNPIQLSDEELRTILERAL